jgi:lipid A 3-O-deacylase
MVMRFKLIAACLLLGAAQLCAQAISTVGIERSPQRDAWWRIVYDNDFFTATDKYFTQGMVIELVTPALRRWPTRNLLIAPRGSVTRFGIAYEDDGYTASDLKVSTILPNDHPYAGTRQLRFFATATDTTQPMRVSSSLNVGLIGQGAGGKTVQSYIHRITGNTIPQGWHNQIRNDVILNYEAMVERPLLQRGRSLLLSGLAVGRIGTFNTAATIGATLMLGHVGSPFSMTADGGCGLYVYLKPQLNIVGYDATLEGGMFNHTSPYTISAGDISRLVYREQYGIVYRSGRHSVEYYRSIGTREFRGGLAHQSGGIQFTMPLGR